MRAEYSSPSEGTSVFLLLCHRHHLSRFLTNARRCVFLSAANGNRGGLVTVSRQEDFHSRPFLDPCVFLGDLRVPHPVPADTASAVRATPVPPQSRKHSFLSIDRLSILTAGGGSFGGMPSGCFDRSNATLGSARSRQESGPFNPAVVMPQHRIGGPRGYALWLAASAAKGTGDPGVYRPRSIGFSLFVRRSIRRGDTEFRRPPFLHVPLLFHRGEAESERGAVRTFAARISRARDLQVDRGARIPGARSAPAVHRSDLRDEPLLAEVAPIDTGDPFRRRGSVAK